jgi:hypothetical protein
MNVPRSTMQAAAPLLAAVTLFAACTDATSTVQSVESAPVQARAGYDVPGAHRQYGVPQKIGKGMVRTYVVLDAKAGNTPLEVGVALDGNALSGLSSTMQMLHLAMPAGAPAPYDFVMFDWNPTGHPPATVYNVPHFDFHFYTVPEAQVMAIDPAGPSWVSGANSWPTDVPPFYAPPTPPGLAHTEAVPFMGLHWSDIRSPELQKFLPSPPGNPANWAPFTRTFIYGSWGGQFTFLEPMITLDYLRTQPDVNIAIPTPANPASAAAFNEAGWYPASYRVTWDSQAKEYRIALAGLSYRN